MMKTLGDSCLKFCYCEHRAQKERFIWFSAIEVSLGRQETCYPRHQILKDGTNLRISSKNKRFHPLSAYQNNTEIEEIQTVDSDLPKSVRVRFKLQRECAFGDQFLVVGNEPGLGLWEPSDGLPLNWSEEHVWLGEVDLPSGKSINYKFVLKSKVGTIAWQTGPDHVLETWDTDKVITVFDDWDSPQPQNVVEEDPLDIVNVETIENEELPNQSVADNIVEDSETIENEKLSNPSFTLVADNIVEDSEPQYPSSSSDDEGNAAFDEKEDSRESAVNVVEDGGDKVIENGSDLFIPGDDDRVPVLVPGLEPPLTEEIIEENKVEATKIENGKNIDDSLKPELEAENGPASASSGSSTEEERKDDEREQQQPRGSSSIVEGDMQWGRRTLQKFLSSLGFQ